MDRIELNLGGRILSMERGEVAKQAHGAVWTRCGDTIVLATACVTPKERENVDFLPLLVEYREFTSAAGKIPGGFFKREGRPTEKETLTSRLIDRSIRPLFPAEYYKEVQINAFVLSADKDNDSDVLGIIGASAALTSSPIPFAGPIGAVRVGIIEDKMVLNPSTEQLTGSALNLVISATDTSLVMMEGWGKEVGEAKFVEAVIFGWNHIKEIIAVQKPWTAAKEHVEKKHDPDMVEQIKKLLDANLIKAYQYPEKKAREQFYVDMRDGFLTTYETDEAKKKEAKIVYEKLFEDKLRTMILSEHKRLDGRAPTKIRDLSSKAGLLPRAHGSAMFTRGQTQCLAALTLGAKSDEQIIDGLFEETSKRFMMHYNFPSFSVGEVQMSRGASRREIGHGALAERSLLPLVPSEEVFPYTIRITANILESNGSSSMATVCAGSLALMDAGAPMTKHVGGIAMGMIMEGEKYMILTDIAGEEDHYGDVDFKVAGTKDGITGFQMDVKCANISPKIIGEALEQSRKARLEIIDSMVKTLPAAREAISPYAPKVMTLKINPAKIGAVIGPGGKIIRAIIERHKVTIDVEDDGSVRIGSTDLEACEKAAQEVRDITDEAELGKIYDGVVTRLMKFGVFVRFMGMQEGMVHISELSENRLDRVEDAVQVGSELKVRVIEIDDQGRVNLSHKQVFNEGAVTPHQRPPRRPGGDRDRGGRGGGFRRRD